MINTAYRILDRMEQRLASFGIAAFIYLLSAGFLLATLVLGCLFFLATIYNKMDTTDARTTITILGLLTGLQCIARISTE